MTSQSFQFIVERLFREAPRRPTRQLPWNQTVATTLAVALVRDVDDLDAPA
jgi:hypothetical protein